MEPVIALVAVMMPMIAPLAVLAIVTELRNTRGGQLNAAAPSASRRRPPKRYVVGADPRTWHQPPWYRRVHETAGRVHPDRAWIYAGADDPRYAVPAAGPQAMHLLVSGALDG